MPACTWVGVWIGVCGQGYGQRGSVDRWCIPGCTWAGVDRGVLTEGVCAQRGCVDMGGYRLPRDSH